MPLVRPKSSAIPPIIERYKAARRHYWSLLDDDGILLLPTLGMLAPRHGAMNRGTLKPGVNGAMTPMTFCNYMDLPAITIPAWSSQDGETGLVPGVMLACAPGAEGSLLDVAAVLEATIR
jgi:Asp-tRNA(Asn)/Glu-tRNA(Gln) amidotransferase A subunit family amidase